MHLVTNGNEIENDIIITMFISWKLLALKIFLFIKKKKH